MSIKLLVFINQAPWNELVLRGERPEKYGGNKINHKGLTLLYTSKSKPDRTALEEYDFDDEELNVIPRGMVVGACEFECEGVAGDAVYHLSNPVRFTRPLPIDKKRGVVRFFTASVTPEIEAELRKARVWEKAVKSDRS